MKIKWIYEGEAGYWRSSEGRFHIAPGGYRHGVTPDYYELSDQFEYFKARIAQPTGNLNLKARRFYTVQEAKVAALNIIAKETL